ncbi:hypothetical protein EDB84DRAFT_1573041 [Lactarius hengduanensis]|nr:hypothetical protein EDB84DRAFT_1573041 [Lactarius hengduanensis]
MAAKGQVVHDQVNLVRLVRPLNIDSLPYRRTPSKAPCPEFVPLPPPLRIFRVAEGVRKADKNKDIATHPLAAQLKSCDNPGAILAVLRAQVQRSQSADEKLTKWLDPTVNVLHAFSETIGNAVGLAFPPATVIFTGIGVLLQAIKDVRAGQHALVDLFGTSRAFSDGSRYTHPCQVTAEVLSILGIVTKEIGERRSKKYIKRLLGLRGTPVEDAVQSLDRLTQEEALMAAAENLKITRGIDNGVKGLQDIGDTLHGFDSDLSSIVKMEGDRMAIQHITNQVSDLNRSDLLTSPADPRMLRRSHRECTHRLSQLDVSESPPGADPSINTTPRAKLITRVLQLVYPKQHLR